MPRSDAEIQQHLQEFRRGSVALLPNEAALVEKLREGRPLRVKLGVDPSSADLHLGHTIPIQKLRRLQQLGHEIHFIIGTFTSQIGDPTGRSKTRPTLSPEAALENARTYADQCFRILDRDRTFLSMNADWLAPLSFADVIHLCAQTTVAQLLQREDFHTRYAEGTPIGLHEFMYCIMQGYDSVHLRADVEIGGTDQTFNLLFGRQLQEAAGQAPQVVLTLPILPGTDGVEKMSKSLGNHIGISESPRDMFGKVMSVPDEVMLQYFELVTDTSTEEIAQIRAALLSGELHPMQVKKRLAAEIVAKYHGRAIADASLVEFAALFQGEGWVVPADTPEFVLATQLDAATPRTLVEVMIAAKLAPSKSEARRLVTQNAVKVNGTLASDAATVVGPGDVVQVGKKRFVRLA